MLDGGFLIMMEERQIVEKIEAERKIVEQNKKLIEIFEEKIKERIEGVWKE